MIKLNIINFRALIKILKTMKFYAIRAGRQTGIFTSWPIVKSHITGFPGAKYKGFENREEAECWLNSNVQPKSDPGAFQLWTDGSAVNGRHASYGFVIVPPAFPAILDEINSKLEIKIDEKFYKGSGYLLKPHPFTSQLAEITAVIEGLRWLLQLFEICEFGFHSIEVYSDSEYVVNTINEWAVTREKSQEGWKGLKHTEFLLPLYEFFKSYPSNIFIKHVKAHVGNLYNEIADKLAKEAGEIASGKFLLTKGYM